MATKRLMMVGGWTDLYEKAKSCGFELTVSQDKGEVAPKDITLVEHLMTFGKNDPLVVDIAGAIHKERPFDCVISFQELGVMNAALIADRFGIQSNPLRPVLLTRDKGAMREHLVEAGIASIPFKVAQNVDDVISFGNSAGWPIILKPLSGVGSHHIHKLHNQSEVGPAFATIRADYPTANPIAEKFMVGPEISVEAVSWNGVHTILGVTDKITTGAPYFLETGHNMPSALDAQTIARVAELTSRFLASIGHMHGPSHTEIIVTADGPIIVESHTRTGGDRIFEMVELVYGVDMFMYTLKGLAGQDTGVTPTEPRGAAIRFIALHAGKVSGIEGVEEVRASKGIVRLDFKLEVGQEIKESKQSIERYGYLLAIGETADEAIANVESALAKLRITVEAM